MNNIVSTTTSHPGFLQYLFTTLRKPRFLFALVWLLLSFYIFKRYYPYANYMSDSYGYLEAAYNNADLNYWPVAYSRFLRLFSYISSSDYLFTLLQYLLLQGASLFFLAALVYFLPLPRWAFLTLYFFLLLNPLPLYIANYIASDALFIAVSILWITQLLFLLYKPRYLYILTHALILLLAFSIKYQAVFYPLISIGALISCRASLMYKLGALTAIAATLCWFYSFTSQKMENMTGFRQFSGFSGWQLANNALYMYEKIPASERKNVPVEFSAIDRAVREHMDTLKKVQQPAIDSVTRIFYLWNIKGPLVLSAVNKWKANPTTPYFTRWAIASYRYRQYGQYLILTYPGAYIRYWMLPNLRGFFMPPTEFLGYYNMGQDSVKPIAAAWFHYTSAKVSNQGGKREYNRLTRAYPIATMLIHIAYLLSFCTMAIAGGLHNKYRHRSFALLIIAFWVVNLLFSLFASSIVMRYQYFPLLLTLSATLYQVHFILLQKRHPRITAADASTSMISANQTLLQ